MSKSKTLTHLLVLMSFAPPLFAQGTMIALLNLKSLGQVKVVEVKKSAPPNLVGKVNKHTGGRYGQNEERLINHIASLYRTHLEREPDVPGLSYYVNRVMEGSLREEGVEQAILRSPEYRSLHPEQSAHQNATYERLKAIADRLASSTSRACYRVAVATAAENGGISDGWQWAETTAYRGRSLSALADAIGDSTLRPGMVVYMNTAPGRDRASLNLSYRPHWMTYLGRDGSGVPRFSDQYGTNYSVDDVVSNYSPRVIDYLFNPYERI